MKGHGVGKKTRKESREIDMERKTSLSINNRVSSTLKLITFCEFKGKIIEK
jgi:hypothetical protein